MTASDNTSQQKKPDTASQISSDMTKETSERKIDDAHEPEQTTEQEYATENSEEESLSETKIVITSPEPDVVIATLDAPDDDSDQSELSSPNTDTAAHASETASEAFHQTQENPDTSEAPNTHVSQPVEPISIDHSIHENDPAVADVADHLTTESTTTNTSGENVESDDDEQQSEEEKIKDEKEAKLESYKQFVAKQFSDKKIDYPEVRVTIEANALPSKMYFVMNTLSAIIASYGLVTNSAAVVIGAMLVAMMLGPITGVALAIIDYRMPLLRKSLLTVLAGVFLVILVGFVVGLLHQGQPLTNEILSRTQPTSMDLMIALAGGTAGAYAMVSPHLSVAVVGVAVATALVPPLAASGILFANGEIQMGLGAALLALTNIIAIQFTNAMVLWFLGFRRLVDDDYESGTYLIFFRRNAVTLLLLVGLGIYLTLNLNSNAKQQTFENNVKEAINEHFIDQGNVLTNIQFDKNNAFQIIRAVVRGETSPNSQDVQQIEDVITKDMAENFPKYLPIKLQLRYLPVQVIESDPLIKDKLDETDAVILTNSP
ncbi:hypothetical protein AOT82_2780 [Psychrobacter sp. AntiMn-1]|uniref:DUF389 domain-containing protein n=1 Tax=Psychrobacter sp. AntiMn-1 TaxID=1720344 RepID=UPI0008A70198|nr:DUF389 domain-containing protein [Psychrobacter sp. AntiMn-1]AOY45159.1 hypothetical protein AOT82_2780 [Psychrobacter sp. AntiMn-1]